MEQVGILSFLLHLLEEFSFVKENTCFSQDGSLEGDTFQQVLSASLLWAAKKEE